jgi:hypothetical protein
MESKYFEIWLKVKADQFNKTNLRLEPLDEQIMAFLEENVGLTPVFSRELNFSNVFEALKRKIQED